MSLISAEGLSLRFGGRAVLRDVSISIARGEIVTIVGPNGSGKTTLLRSLLGVFPQAEGRITRAPGLRIGYVPQRLHLDANLPMTVKRFMSLPRLVSKAQALRALANSSAEHLWNARLHDLSGGQLQRVLLARATLNSPDLLVLDEPTTGLDQAGSAQFYQLIEQVARGLNAAVLMVSHELHVVMSASDRVICLNEHICCEGSPAHVSSAPAYRELFGTGTGGALALYRHEHDHSHDGACLHTDQEPKPHV